MESQKTSMNGLEIAVIGMAGRFPGAQNVASFWDNLKNGVESISFFSDEELSTVGVERQLLENSNYIKAYGTLENEYIEFFDAHFFGYPPREAATLNPQVRLFLECSWEALENAGYEPEFYKGLIGIYAGASTSFTWEAISYISGNEKFFDSFSLFLLTDKDFLSTRISYKLNLKGPALNVQTACSTSLVAIHQASRALLTGECDMALAGGVTIRLPQQSGYLYQTDMIKSQDGHCRAFDARAAGVNSGSGIGIVVLKRLNTAIADGDEIYAIIKGSAINNDGNRKVGYTAPSVEGQADVIKAAHQAAEVEPESIGYIEAHGTATSLGDPVEIEALKLAFNSQKKGFCGIGSVKSNIGHLDSAAGVAGFIKTVLALKHRLIPPSLHFETLNPRIDFANSPFYVNTRLREWNNGVFPLRAGVSSFGIGGTNAHVVLEGWPGDNKSVEEESRQPQLILLSAQTLTALEKMTGNLSEYLKKCLAHPGNYGSILGNTAYTLQVGRRSFQYKRMLVCSGLEQAAAALSSPGLPGVRTFGAKEKKPQLVFMFPGQGSQYVNMGRGLYESEPLFREKMDLCFEILKPLMGYDIKEMLYPPVNPEASNATWVSTQLQQTEIAQPLLFAFEYALTRLLMEWGLVPYAMIGHSIGEYTAACLSGVFSLEAALMVVALRGKLMQRMPAGEMLSVSLSEEKLQDLLTDEISLAAINGTSRCVVSGPAPAIDSFINRMNQRGYDCQYRRLHTSHAFHSAMVEPILKEFEQELNNVTYGTPKIPYISNVSGTWITVEQAVDPRYWARQLREPVRFHAGIQELSGSKRENIIFVEMGPGKTLTTLIKQDSVREKTAVNLVRHPGEDIPDDYYLLSKIGQLWLYSIKVDWQALHMKEKRQRIPLPTYPFDRRRCWIDIKINQPGEKAFGPILSYLKSREPGTTDSEPGKPNTGILSGRPSLTTSYVAPQNEIEQELVKLWEDFFGINMIGTNDDFFELGGDSLKATSILAKIHKVMNLKVELAEMFKNPTIAGLAAHSLSTGAHLYTAISPNEQKEYYQLSSAQKRLYILQQMNPTAVNYNIPIAVAVRGKLHREKLEAAFKKLMNRHESLRTSFILVEHQPYQKIQVDAEWEIEYYDKKGVEEIIKNFVKPFDLSKGPLLRVGLIKEEEEKHVLIVDIHHIITDGTSMVILIRELMQEYNGEELPLLRIQYKDFSEWQNSLFASGQVKRQEEYWLKEFAGEIPALDLPLDYERPAKRSVEGNVLNFMLDSEETAALKRLALDEKVTLYIVLLVLYNILLSKVCRQQDIVVGTSIAGRRHADLEPVIGMFVNTLALRNRPTGEKNFKEFLKEVRERILEAFKNQDYHFEDLVEKAAPYRDASRNPLFDVRFSFHNEAQTDDIAEIELPGLKLVPYKTENQTSKSDITLQGIEIGDKLLFTFEYCTKLFKRATIERLVRYFKEIVGYVKENKDIKLKDIRITHELVAIKTDVSEIDLEF